MEIRRIDNSNLTNVVNLITDVFMKFEAMDYSEEGVRAFFDTAINNQEYMDSLAVYGAYLNNSLIGVIATRNEGKTDVSKK